MGSRMIEEEGGGYIVESKIKKVSIRVHCPVSAIVLRCRLLTSRYFTGGSFVLNTQ